MPDNHPLLVHATCPNTELAQRIAESLVTDRLAACVNILPGAQSVYRWQGQVEQDTECLLFIKTSSTRLAALQSRILELHVDEVPEIIACRISDGLPGYLQWLTEETTE